MLVLYRAALHHLYKLFELGRWWIIAIHATLYILEEIWARLSIVCLPVGEKRGGGAGKFSLFFFVLFFNTFA